MTDALKLAEELESAVADIQGELFRKIGEWMKPSIIKKNLFNWAEYERFVGHVKSRAYLSAADVLRPEGWYFGSDNRLGEAPATAWGLPPDGKGEDAVGSEAATEPMARAAAAIRARVAMETQHD